MKKIVLLVFLCLGAITALKASVPVSLQKTVTISWQGQPAKFYQVYQSTNLLTWAPVDATIIGDTNVFTRSYPMTSASSFFKVEEVSRPNLNRQLIYKKTLTNLGMTQSSLNQCDIVFSDFTGSTMNVCNLSGTTIDGTRFDYTDMRSASMQGCPYVCASFYGATLWNTLFQNSYFYECDFRNAVFNYNNGNFGGCTIAYCDFTGATGLNPAGGHFVCCTMPDGSFRNDP